MQAFLTAVALMTGAALAADPSSPFKLSSPAFKSGEAIASKNTCDGKDLSPALEWNGVPEKAAALALIVDDPDAPPGVWVHWVVYDLPPTPTRLPEGQSRSKTLRNGAVQGASWGVDTFERLGYYGPCPPPGRAHHYRFHLYALDRKLGVPPKTTKPLLLEAMHGHILAETELVGTYARK